MTPLCTQSRINVPHAELTTYCWLPERDPKAVLLILHGMGDHGGRYDHFARYLARYGFAVRAHDHRGHGLTGHRAGPLGHFADEGGWDLVTRDVLAHIHEIHQTSPRKKLILLGHSMGSFIAQECLIRYGVLIDGVILSGSSGAPTLVSRLAKYAAQISRLLRGSQGSASLLDQVSTYLFNQAFKPALTSCDWLSRDEEQVQRYLNDPLCQFTNTAQLWIDLLEGIKNCSRPHRQRLIPTTSPVYLFAGDQDPVSSQGQGVRDLATAYKNAGLRDVTTRLYEGGRHEMLNEINRDEVYADLLEWIQRHSSG